MPQVDGFSRIRSQLENKIFPKRFRDADGERDEKVIARTYDCYVSEQPAKTFLDFERRALHRYTGFDSLAHVPYRPFAGLKHTDAYRLIEDAMGLSFLRTDIHQSFSDSGKECAKVSSHANQQTIRVVRDCGGGRKAKVLSKTAGLSAIQLHLGSTRRATREVAAGAAYYDTLPREEERKTFLLKMRAPKRLKSADDDTSSKTCLTSWRPMQLKSHALSDKKHNHQSNLLIGSDTPNDEVGTSECLRVGPNIYVAVAAAHFKLHFGHPGRKKEISPAKKLQMRKCLVKMKAVYSILCCLYNMKMKELKNKRPLSVASIKQMSVKPLPNRESTHHHAHRFGTHTHNYHSHTPSHHLQPLKYAGQSVETWEDLMLVTRTPASSNDTASPLIAPSVYLEPHQKMARILPPWQRQLVFVDSSENSTGDPASAIAECISGFQSAKDQISEQTKSLLRRRQKSSTHLMGVKARELRLSANTESCLHDMREKAYQISRAERSHEENRPSWFGQLEKEVESHVISNHSDQNTAVGRAARQLLERMKYFLYTDIDTIPRVMEKLCLLVMSMPSDQLCLTPVITAVQFVLEHILEVPDRLCLQWLEMRGLPATGVPLTPQPVIVFGLTV